MVFAVAFVAAYQDQGIVRAEQDVESLVDESGLYHQEVVNAGRQVQLVLDTSLVVDCVWEWAVQFPVWNELAAQIPTRLAMSAANVRIPHVLTFHQFPAAMCTSHHVCLCCDFYCDSVDYCHCDLDCDCGAGLQHTLANMYVYLPAKQHKIVVEKTDV